MEYTQVKEWMDKQIANLKEANALRFFNEQICTCHPETSIHIFRGIDILADVMRLELKEEDRGDSDFPYSYSFVYEGVRFFQIQEERLESFDGTD